MFGQRLNHAEAESGAADAAAGKAEGGAVEPVERAIEGFAVLDPVAVFVAAAASVGILVGARQFDVLRPDVCAIVEILCRGRWSMDCGGFLSQTCSMDKAPTIPSPSPRRRTCGIPDYQW